MKVFKFGGASVKDANAVRNVASILTHYPNEKLGVVISAMGKTTNAMEKIVDELHSKNHEKFEELVEERRTFHKQIITELFKSTSVDILDEVNAIFDELLQKIDSSTFDDYHFEYDQVVSLGEVVSTKIVNAYLQQEGFKSSWVDARKLIRTNRQFREAEVDWEQTELLFQTDFLSKYSSNDVLITQGFIGHTPEGHTTTLGREGSDFSAGILAYCSNAESVTIWKDVPGMLNADPKYFDDTIKLDQISFKEAIELSYYGASVIHPKTIKPLQNKRIPLYVKSFVDPAADGTIIQANTESDHLIPSFIFKMNQMLISITPKDFSFIAEKKLSDIFDRLTKANVKINIMQNSALDFSILLDEEKINLELFLNLFEPHYCIKIDKGLELITIRHYDQPTIDRVLLDKEVLLEQKTKETARFVVRKK